MSNFRTVNTESKRPMVAGDLPKILEILDDVTERTTYSDDVKAIRQPLNRVRIEDRRSLIIRRVHSLLIYV